MAVGISKLQLLGISGTYLALFLYGCGFSSLSLIIPSIALDLSRELSELASLYFLQFIGYCLAVGLLMLWSYRIRSGAALGGGVLLLIVGGLLSWLVPSLQLLRLTVFIVGLGMGFINMSGLALLNAVSRRYGSVMVNYSRAVVSMGSFLAPLTITALLHLNASWRVFYLIVAALGGAALTIAYPLLKDEAGRRVVAAKSEVKDSVKDRGFWVLLACVVLYVGAELAVWSWGASFMTNKFGVSLQTAQEVVSVFFGVFVLGRFFLPPVFIKFGLKRSLDVALIVGLAVAVPTLFTESWWLFTKLYPLLGLILAPIIPTLMALSSERYRQAAGFSLASLTLGIGLAAALFPWILGVITTWVSIEVSVSWAVVVLMVSLNLVLWIWRMGEGVVQKPLGLGHEEGQ